MFCKILDTSVGDGERQLHVTLFEAAEKMIGFPVTKFIKSKELVSLRKKMKFWKINEYITN